MLIKRKYFVYRRRRCTEINKSVERRGDELLSALTFSGWHSPALPGNGLAVTSDAGGFLVRCAARWVDDGDGHRLVTDLRPTSAARHTRRRLDRKPVARRFSCRRQIMLRLHEEPGSHGSPVCPKRSKPWNFGHFFSVFKFCYVLLSFLTVSVTSRIGESSC